MATKTTRAFGCSTKWSYKRESVARDQACWEAIEETQASLDGIVEPVELRRQIVAWLEEG